MRPIEVLVEEYKSVRHESLDALNQIQTIMQYGLASVGVVVGLGLVTADRDTAIAAVVLMALAPTLIVFGTVMMAVAVHRVVQTRCYLRDLERRIADQFDEPTVLAGWERTRAGQEGVSGGSGYPFAIAAAAGTIAVVGPGLGGFLLASDGSWAAFAIALAIDLVALAAFVRWCVVTYRRIRDLAEPAPARAPAPVV